MGSDALIMSRPVDDNHEWSPRNIVFMGWVGDEEATYDGLKTALRYMLESGRRGYVGFGSDIGGYNANSKAGKLGRTKELFLRWTAIGALSSFMENGGEGEHLPWNFDNETIDIYRQWVNLHYSLIPYLYSEGTMAALSHNSSLMTPCDDLQCTFSYAYYLGRSIYVVPVLHDPIPNQRQRIWLPSSSTGHWISGFNGSIEHKARSFIQEDTSHLDRIPFYVQKGTLMPMYDLEQNIDLNIYKFVLWGKTIENQPITNGSLFTRDGQQWLLQIDHSEKRLITKFISWHRSNDESSMKMVNYLWRFCQFSNEKLICTKDSIQLIDRSVQYLDNLS